MKHYKLIAQTEAETTVNCEETAVADSAEGRESD